MKIQGAQRSGSRRRREEETHDHQRNAVHAGRRNRTVATGSGAARGGSARFGTGAGQSPARAGTNNGHKQRFEKTDPQPRSSGAHRRSTARSVGSAHRCKRRPKLYAVTAAPQRPAQKTGGHKEVHHADRKLVPGQERRSHNVSRPPISVSERSSPADTIRRHPEQIRAPVSPTNHTAHWRSSSRNPLS